jgi:hypothetical protein
MRQKLDCIFLHGRKTTRKKVLEAGRIAAYLSAQFEENT